MKIKSIFLIILFCFSAIGWAQSLDFMTYNIKFASEFDGVNSWSQRKNDLAQQILYYKPDVLGMQEVLKEQLDFLLNKIPEYKAIGNGRDGGDQGEFSPIFYNLQKLKLLKSGTFWLSETPEIPGKSWDAAFPRICTYAKFNSISENREFWVFNTHLDHVGVIARKNSLQLIQSEIKKLNIENHPFILIGDFNLPHNSDEIETFKTEMKHDFSQFSDAYDIAHYGSTGTFNGYQFITNLARIDYIFCSGFNVVNHRIIEDKRSNGLWFSDHLPVVSQMSFQK